MHHTFTRNRTYTALDRAENPLYKNIRTIKREQMVNGGARWDGDELYILPPPPPPAGGRFAPSPTQNASVRLCRPALSAHASLVPFQHVGICKCW